MGRWRKRQNGERRISSLPLLVVIVTLLSWTLFRLSIFFSVPLTCMPTYEFWTQPAGDAWPLFGSFVLVFVLLLIWICALWFDLSDGPRIHRRLVAIAGFGVCAICASLWYVLGAIQLNYDDDAGLHSAWLRDRRYSFERSDCDEARPYLGDWRVEAVEAPFPGPVFPYTSLVLRRDFSLKATRVSEREPVFGRWRPPHPFVLGGSISTDDLTGRWLFELEGDTLSLVAPEGSTEPFTRIVLRRIGAHPSRACANPRSC